jgi:DNA-binding protein HU-beta
MLKIFIFSLHSLTNKQKGNKMAKAKKKAAPKKAVKKAAPKKAVAKKAAPKKAVKKVAKKAAPKKAVAKGPMTKAAIVDHLATKLDVTKKVANQFLSELNELVYKNAKKSLTIPGLGKFFVQKYKKRNGRNPATGEAMVIPAKTKVRFKVGKALQDAVYPPKK